MDGVNYRDIARAGLGNSPIIDPRTTELVGRASGTLGHDYYYNVKGEQAANGHYTDKGKMLNHPTFSNESMMHSPAYRGGQWGRADGKDTFTPSPDMINSGATNRLGDYFDRFEPNAKLVTPIPYTSLKSRY